MFSFTASVDGQRLAQSGAQGGGQTGQVVVTSAGQIQGQVVGGLPKYTRHSSVANIHHEGASSGSSQDGHLVVGPQEVHGHHVVSSIVDESSNPPTSPSSAASAEQSAPPSPSSPVSGPPSATSSAVSAMASVVTGVAPSLINRLFMAAHAQQTAGSTSSSQNPSTPANGASSQGNSPGVVVTSHHHSGGLGTSNGESNSTSGSHVSTPVTSPLASPVASPQPRGHHHPHPHHSTLLQAAAAAQHAPPVQQQHAHTQIRSGGAGAAPSPSAPGGASNSFVFPSSDGGSLLVQRLVVPPPPPVGGVQGGGPTAHMAGDTVVHHHGQPQVTVHLPTPLAASSTSSMVQVSDHHAIQSHPYHQAASAAGSAVKRVPPSALPHYSHTPSSHPMTAAARHPPPHHLLTTTPGLPFVSQHPLKPGSLDSPRTDPTVPPGHKEHGFNLVGNKYLLLDQLEGSHLQRCIDVQTQQEYVCKTVKNDPAGHAFLSAHLRVDGHAHINPVHEVLVGDASTYLVFPPCHVDLHSYVRTKRRLREPQARPLFRQIVAAVHEAHSKGIVLRDLKLRKFVFTDELRVNLKLESLEDAVVLDEMDHDLLSDKHGCPAYVSPEILKRDAIYSGRAADMWGLGVMLYTMLVGRYPFHGQEHTGLFAKIRRGQFNIPDSISSRAKCLIRCLLRKEPEDRLSTEDVLAHPWVNQHSAPNSTSLLSASSTSSSRSLQSGSSESSRSSRRHHHHHHSSHSSHSSSSSSASTPMSVAPPSVVTQVAGNSSGSTGAAAHLAPPIHPTLIAASAQLAAAAAAASATATPIAPPMIVPIQPGNGTGNEYAMMTGDQTVPESIQADYAVDN